MTKIILSILLPYIAYSETITCPETVDFKTKAINTPRPFKAFPKKSLYKFRNISVYSGHPSEFALLKPDPDYQGNVHHPLWIRCEYDSDYHGATHSLTRKLKPYKSCKPVLEPKRKHIASRYAIKLECH